MSVKQKRSIILIIIMTLVATTYVFAEEILSNETVVSMVKAKFGETLIISKIKSSKNKFDVSTDAIIELKNQGVSEKIIQTMVEASSVTNTGASEQKSVQVVNPWAAYLGLPASMTISSSSLCLKKDNKVVEMPPIVAEVQHSMAKHFIPFYFGPGDNWHYIRGEKSVIRLNDKKPVFYTKMNPSSFLLVKLLYRSGKDIRYVVSTGGTYRNTIPLGFNKKSDDFFESFPKEELLDGEYAVVSSMTFYDFGINGKLKGTQSSEQDSKQSKDNMSEGNP